MALLAGFSQAQLSNFDNIIIVDGTKYARTAAGVQAAVNAAGAKSLIVLSSGAYAFGSTSVTVSTLRTHIVGAGKWATEIDYCGPGAAFIFSAGAAVMYQSSLEGMGFNGACDRGNVNQKIAVKLSDVSEFNLTDIAVLNWHGNSGSSSTPSIGVDIRGRELGTLERLSIYADRPIYIEANPNGADMFDAFRFKDLYLLVGVPAESCVSIGPIAQATAFQHWRIDGFDCILGQYGIYLNDTVGTASFIDWDFRNMHWEQQTGGEGILFIFQPDDWTN